MSITMDGGCTSSCHTSQTCSDKGTIKSHLMKAAILITRVALAALAFMTDAYLFMGFFAAGFVFGVYKAITAPKVSYEGFVKGCSNDLLEEMAGTKLPQGFGLAVGALTFACHIEHHPLVFVPLISGATGYWAGHQVVDGCKWMGTKVKALS